MVQNEYIVDVEKGRVHYQNRTYGLREFFEMVDDNMIGLGKMLVWNMRSTTHH